MNSSALRKPHNWRRSIVLCSVLAGGGSAVSPPAFVGALNQPTRLCFTSLGGHLCAVILNEGSHFPARSFGLRLQ
jgi:hypothetical protein